MKTSQVPIQVPEGAQFLPPGPDSVFCGGKHYLFIIIIIITTTTTTTITITITITIMIIMIISMTTVYH